MIEDDLDYYRQEEALDELFAEHTNEFKKELAFDALLKTETDVLVVRGVLEETAKVLPVSPTAAHLLAASACEMVIRKLLFVPVLTGLIHTDIAVTVVVQATSRLQRDQLDKALTTLLSSLTFTNLAKTRRTRKGSLILTEAADIAKKRDAIVHHGERADAKTAEEAMKVADYLLNNVFAGLLHEHRLRMLAPGEKQPISRRGSRNKVIVRLH
jgi:hypothetical protein